MSTTISQISKTSWVIIIIIKTICTAQDDNVHDNFTNIKDQLGNNNNNKDDLYSAGWQCPRQFHKYQRPAG